MNATRPPYKMKSGRLRGTQSIRARRPRRKHREKKGPSCFVKLARQSSPSKSISPALLAFNRFSLERNARVQRVRHVAEVFDRSPLRKQLDTRPGAQSARQIIAHRAPESQRVSGFLFAYASTLKKQKQACFSRRSSWPPVWPPASRACRTSWPITRVSASAARAPTAHRRTAASSVLPSCRSLCAYFKVVSFHKAGMMRYSLPTCQPALQLGDACRPASNRPINTTLSYPGGLRLSLHHVYQVAERLNKPVFFFN